MAQNDLNLNEIGSTLYTAVLSDVLVDFGYKDQTMSPYVRPLEDGYKLIDYARTGLFMNAYSVAEDENLYEFEIDVIENLKPEEVSVLGCNRPTTRIILRGELLTTAL